MKTSKIIFVCNSAIFHLFSLVLCCLFLGTHSVYVFIVYLFYIGYLFSLKKSLVVFTLLINLCFIVKYHSDYKALSINDFDKTIICTIHSIPKYEEDRVSFFCQNNSGRILIQTSSDQNFTIGDVVRLDNHLVIPENNTIPFLFNYKNYLLAKQIFYISYQERIKVVSSSDSLHLLMIKQIMHYYERFNCKSYILSLLVGDKNSLDDNFIDQAQVLNISHLFVVSGFHVGFLYFILQYIFKYLRITKETSTVSTIIFLLLFLILNNFAISVTRAVVLIVLIQLKRRFKIPFSNVKILSLLVIINLFIHPFLFYDSGFVLSYLITFVLFIGWKIYKGNKITFLYKINLLAQLFSLPIIANFSFFYNFLSFLFVPILSLLYTYFVFPLTLFIIVLPPFDYLCVNLFYTYEKLISSLSLINYFVYNIGSFTPLRSILYYLFIFLIMLSLEKGKKPLIQFSLVLFIVLFYHRYSLIEEVTFLDVGQGDSTYIHSGDCRALIDTGGSNRGFHPGENIFKYLKAQQIDHLDVLFISHTDVDHAGDYRYILEYFHVNTIVFSAFDESLLHEEIEAFAKSKKINIMEASAYNTVQCGRLLFNIINPIEKNNTINDNSLVLFLIFNGDRYLFTGDISSDIENDLIKHFSLSTTFLKVSHHGSKYSSNTLFLNHIKPQYAIISVGVNYYSHPNSDVLERLMKQKAIILRTDLNGSVSVKYYLRKKRMIITHSPHNKNTLVS